MKIRTIKFAFAGVAALVAIMGASACSKGGGFSQYGGYQIGGHYVILSQNCYFSQNFPNLDNTDAQELQKISSYTLAQGTKLQSTWAMSLLKGDDPNNCGSEPEPSINSVDFTRAPAANVDFLWYTGHGDLGRVALYYYEPANGYNNQDGDATAFGGDDPNLPWAQSSLSGLKWVFLNSSVSVQLDSNPASYWGSAFNAGGNGIHGIYGFEGEPNSLDDNTLVDTFLDDAVQTSTNSNASNIRGAWIDAAEMDNGGQYGVYELFSAGGDQLSGYSTAAGFNPPFTSNSQYDPNLNPLEFYDSSNCAPCSMIPTLTTQLSQVSPGSYTPMTLKTEGWTDSYLASQANQYESGSYKYYENTNTYHIQSASYNASHYEASSAIVAHAAHSTVPYNFQLTDAENFAVSEMQQHGGIPSDAVLYRVLANYQTSGAGTVVTGYTFFWRHQSDVRGGDRIIIGVDNMSSQQCTHEKLVNCTYVCDQWETVYAQHINFMYRLWRTLGSAVPNPPIDQPDSTVATGAAEESPSTAYSAAMNNLGAKGQTNLGTFTGYTVSYWTPPYYSTDNTAYPSFNYYFSSGAVVIADAGTGMVRAIQDQND